MANAKAIWGAKAAAQEVLMLLDSVEDTLRGARNWSLCDLFARENLVSSWIKFGKISQAEEQLRLVQSGLLRLENELRGVNGALRDSLDLRGFQNFMDIMFDNALSDWVTQRKINAGLKEIQYLRLQIERVVCALEELQCG